MPSILAWIYAFALTSDYFLTETHSKHELEQSVLLGNYGNMGVPNNKIMRRRPSRQRQRQDRRFMGRGMMMENETIDPNAMIELSEGHHYPYKIIYQAYEALVEGQVQIKSRSAGGNSTFVDCLNKLATCATLPISNYQCYAGCMMSKNPALKKTTMVLPHKIKSMCEPIGTIFDKMIERVEKKMSNIKRSSHYMKLFETKPEHFKSYAKKACLALQMQITSNIKKPQLADQRRWLRPIQTAVDIADKSFRKQNSMNNEICKNMSFMEVYKEVISVFTKKPRMTDMMLGGYHLARSIAQHVPGPHQPMFTAFHEVVSILTGSQCGLIHYAETGEKLDCQEKGDEEEEKKPRAILPPQFVAPDPYKGACWTIPEFPSFDMNMGFKFPKIDKE